MNILITGGAGFLAQKLASEILKSESELNKLVLVDILMPPVIIDDERLHCIASDLTKPENIHQLFSDNFDVIYHLAAIVSSHAEEDLQVGYSVNLDLSRMLLEKIRDSGSPSIFVFASSLAIYGGNLPEQINEQTSPMPQSSYGTQKAMVELLVNDYSRRGILKGRVVRLPTICVRPGKPNKAASSFVSSIIREPISGEEAILPVNEDLTLWLSSPDTVIKNLLKAAKLPQEIFGNWPIINLPGISVSVKQMLHSLEKVSGPETLSMIKRIPDPKVVEIVNSWPSKIDHSKALKLGFEVDIDFESFLHQYLATL